MKKIGFAMLFLVAFLWPKSHLFSDTKPTDTVMRIKFLEDHQKLEVAFCRTNISRGTDFKCGSPSKESL